MDSLFLIGPSLALLLIVGCCAGLIAGLLGVGGGIVIVPALFWYFQQIGVPMESAIVLATGSSLLTIVPTSIASTISHRRQQHVDIGLLKYWSPLIILGSIIGSTMLSYLDGVLISTLFAFIAFFAAMNAILRSSSDTSIRRLPHRIIQSFFASMIGFFSVIAGVGGGALGVPVLSYYGLPIHRAVGTAAVFGFLIAAPASMVMLLVNKTPLDAPWGSYGFVHFPSVAIIISMSVFFAPLGAKLNARLSTSLLKALFVVFLLLAGIKMLWSGIFNNGIPQSLSIMFS